MHILLLEDAPDVGQALSRLLRRAKGYDVTLVTTLADAATAAKAWHFDVLLADIGLPDGDGRTLLTLLDEADRPPVRLVLSAYDAVTEIDRSLAMGFAGHLVKPIHFDVLCDAIERLMHLLEV